MSKEDYYSILNVSKNASKDDIKRSYRELAMKYHPDRNSNDANAEEKFKKVSEAYQILSDPQKRQLYDLHGHAGVDPSAASNAYSNASMNFSDIFGDVFGDIFGRSGSGSGGGVRVQRGDDLLYNLDLQLEDAVKSTTVKIKVKTLITCKSCTGSGAKNNEKPTTCTVCGGHGQVRTQQGFFSIQQACYECKGNGSIIRNKCRNCYGDGRVEAEKHLSAKIPAGVDNGDRIRLAGEGVAGPNRGKNGDLYIQINVLKHDIFTRKDTNLYCEVPISFVTATLGGDIEIPTLDGRIKLKVPGETQTGRLFRLRSKGIRSLKSSGPGDLLCRVIVETPVNLNKKQKSLLIDLDSSMEKHNNRHNPQASSWLKLVKNFFEKIKP